MGVRARLALVVLVEALYMTASRAVQAHFGWSSIEGEFLRTAMRIVTAAVYWGLFRELIFARAPNVAALRGPLPLAGLLLFLSIPVLVGNYGLDRQLATLFALTSIPVALKEELLFRGIAQNLLETRFGPAKAVGFASAIFTAWHIGVVEPSVAGFAQIFLASVVVGVAYLRSRSLLAAIAMHAAYDALFSFSPLLPNPVGEAWGLAPLLGSAALLLAWAWRDRGQTAVPGSR